MGQESSSVIRLRTEIKRNLDKCFLNFKIILQLSVHTDAVTCVIILLAKMTKIILLPIYSIFYTTPFAPDTDKVMIFSARGSLRVATCSWQGNNTPEKGTGGCCTLHYLCVQNKIK